jgi:hypothetical protein
MRTPDRAHVERLVARVEDENVLHLARHCTQAPTAVSAGYEDMARSTASSSSGDRAITALPWSSSFT